MTTRTDAQQIRISVTTLARRMRQHRPRSGLSLLGLSVLARLERGGPLTSSGIAAAEGIQPQSLTRLLAQLCRDELVKRSTDPVDHRRAHLVITPAGRAVLTRDRDSRDEWLARVIAERLDSDERDELRAALRLLDELSR